MTKFISKFSWFFIFSIIFYILYYIFWRGYLLLSIYFVNVVVIHTIKIIDNCDSSSFTIKIMIVKFLFACFDYQNERLIPVMIKRSHYTMYSQYYFLLYPIPATTTTRQHTPRLATTAADENGCDFSGRVFWRFLQLRLF